MQHGAIDSIQRSRRRCARAGPALAAALSILWAVPLAAVAREEGGPGSSIPSAEGEFSRRSGEAFGDLLIPETDQFAHTTRFLFGRLTRPSSRSRVWWTLAGVLGASAILEHNKLSVQSELLDLANEESNEVSKGAKMLGDPGMVPALGALLLLNGMLFRQPQARETGWMVLESALYTGLFSEVGKFVLSEERPDQGGDLRFFTGGGHGVSGHAAIAASVAAPLSRGLFRIEDDDGRWKRFGKRLGTGFAYGLPVLTGLSRIEDDRHYAWNVLLGLALGFTVGDTVADAHDELRQQRESRWKPDSVGPVAAEGGAGIGLSWRF
jgi:membrane-associated phospholipid phosphatase